MISWRELLRNARSNANDKSDIVYCNVSEDVMNKKFDNGWGATEGEPFTVWSETHVYFPLEYDGAEYVGYAPRFPNDDPMSHQ